MMNWRHPVLTVYDRVVARSPIPGYRRSLSLFHELPLQQRRDIQITRLARLLRHAAQHVPWYRDELVQLGVVRGDVLDLERFSTIRPLTRDVLREHFDSLTSDDLASRRWYRNCSGGSTGEPVAVLQDRDYEAAGLAAIEMHQGWAGRQPGEPMVRLWASERDILLGSQGWRNQVSAFARNQVLLNAFRMNTDAMERYVDQIRRRRPVLVEAFAESAYEIARHLNETGRRLQGVRGVVTSASTLYPFIRTEVEQAFGCPIYNRYGSREVGSFAGERTPGGGLEVFAATHWVEVVRPDGQPCAPGEEGDVLVTCLTNLAMPLIRYRIGDRATVGEAVATPTPSVEVLQTVTGRANDAFVRPDGTTVPGIFFMYFIGVFYSRDWIRMFQVVQRGYDDVVIRIVPAADPPANALQEIGDTLRRVVGQSCRVDFEFTDTIEKLSSGKHRYLVPFAAPPPRGTSPWPAELDDATVPEALAAGDVPLVAMGPLAKAAAATLAPRADA
jgi:phenylacetate-CoA ligase